MTFGQFFTELREAQGLTLTEFSKKHNFERSTISKLENGSLRAPQMESKLESYAKALGLIPSSTKWLRFYDLAQASNRSFEVKNITDPNVLRVIPALLRIFDRKETTSDEVSNALDLLTARYGV